MSLSCSCGEWEGDGEGFDYPVDFSVMPERKRRVRCASCGVFIEAGEDSLEFQRFRAPLSEVEEKIRGEQVPIASKWHCARCGEIYLNLTAAGYCLQYEDSMPKAMREYHEATGFDPARYVEVEG